MDIKLVAKEQIADFIDLIKVFEKVFEMKDFKMPSQSHLKKLLQKDEFFAVVAKDNERIIGGLTVYTLDQYYSTRPLAYIYDLAVLNEYQRKGVGTKLVEFTTDYCRKNGFEEVFVQADKVDEYAVDFYRKTKPTEEEDVLHFYYAFKG